MIIKNDEQLAVYKAAGEVSLDIMGKLRDKLAIGISPLEIDKYAGDLCRQHGVQPAFFNVKGGKSIYGYNTCISLNSTAVHGIPGTDPLVSGDIVKLDFGIVYKGYYTDHCYTFGIGAVSDEDKRLIASGKLAVESAVKQAVVGNTVGDLGQAMHSVAKISGFDTIKEYIGHGIGKTLHEMPEIPAYGTAGRGAKLQEGMVICVEAQVVAGSDSIFVADDGWSVVTRDGKNAVMFEYMLVVGKDKPLILTDNRDWPYLL